MPKAKSHKGSLKRFKVTGGGKLRRRSAGKRHINSHFTGKRSRQLRQPVAADNAIALKYVDLITSR